MAREPLVIGPFAGGLNTYDDPTAVKDTELVECLNWDPGLEGSLRSRPPFTDRNNPLPLGLTGSAKFLGFFYGSGGAFYLIASDGLSSTWALNGQTNAWSLITSTFAASSMAQFDNKAWLASPVGEADPGGSWTPGGGFVADADMPRGDSVVSFKARLWISPGKGNPNGTRVYYSKVLGQPNFWQAPSFVDVGQGDGQDIVLLTTYYNTLVAFRTQSIYAFSFNADPAQGSVALLVPGVGLTSKECLISYENYLYFMYDEKAYQFINNGAQQINLKVPFTATSKATNALPFSVSLFNNRAIFHYYDTMYVYSLRTKTWTRWRSPKYGSIGQIMSPAGVLTDKAFVNPSLVQPLPSTRKNLLSNAAFRVDTALWSPRSGGGGVAALTRHTDGVGAPVSSYARITYTTQGTWFRASYNIASMPVTPGVTYTLSGYMRAGAPITDARVIIVWRNDSGNTIVENPAGNTLVGTSFTRVSATATAPAGAVSARGEFGRTAGLVGEHFDITAGLFEAAPEAKDWFDGGSPDTVFSDHDWDGTPGASPSTHKTKRVSPLLYIADEFTNDTEDFTCEVQTKNYNYQLSSNFKRLFWWGVDAVFRTRIRGWAVPVVHHSSVTWGQLRAQGVTWGQLLGGTWGSPFIGDISVYSDYDLGGTGPMRKFVKMFKSMRFRQIYFRLIFDTDGSIGTAPVNLFTITAYVGSKETVSKPVS